jgi:tetratricopeptide (TPR) repeat protein
MGAPEEQYFSSLDPSIRGHKARHNLAVVYLESGRPDQAERQWRQAIAETPAFTPAWDGLCELLSRRQDWPALQELAAEAAVHNQNLALTIEARAHLAQRHFVPAVTALRAVLASDPSHEVAQRLLTYGLLQSGRVAEAEAELRRLTQLAPDDVEAQHNLAGLLCESGRHAEALSPAEAAVRLSPERPQGYYLLADVQQRMGETDAARETLRRLLEARPDEAHARDLLTALEEPKAGRLWEPPARLDQPPS